MIHIFFKNLYIYIKGILRLHKNQKNAENLSAAELINSISSENINSIDMESFKHQLTDALERELSTHTNGTQSI